MKQSLFSYSEVFKTNTTMKYRSKTDAELRTLEELDRKRIAEAVQNIHDKMKEGGIRHYQVTPPEPDWELQNEISRRYDDKKKDFKRKYIQLPLGILIALGILLWLLTR